MDTKYKQQYTQRYGHAIVLFIRSKAKIGERYSRKTERHEVTVESVSEWLRPGDELVHLGLKYVAPAAMRRITPDLYVAIIKTSGRFGKSVYEHYMRSHGSFANEVLPIRKTRYGNGDFEKKVLTVIK